jgi:hypothetical protein
VRTHKRLESALGAASHQVRAPPAGAVPSPPPSTAAQPAPDRPAPAPRAAAQVLTPVRRSARVAKPERLGAPLDAMLESTSFCYAPNAALQEVDDVAEATGALPASSALKGKAR